MESTKSPLSSVTVWAGLTTILASLLAATGYTIGVEDQAAVADGAVQVVGLVTSVTTLVSGAVAIWGRIRATKKLV